MSRYKDLCQRCYVRLRYHRIKADQGDGRTPTVWKLAVDRRRARRTAAFVEDLTLAQVATRDGWRCHLCNESVDPEAMGDWSATVDHVLPLSLGGLHALNNVALAHRWCNLSKGNRVA